MLANLLTVLFGSRSPSDLARASQPSWDAWLRPINAQSPSGTDPAYDDDFIAIKDEVAKLSEIDDSFIVETAERLLKHHAKDVRVAVYYLYGRMRRDGAAGAAAGFELLSALLDRYGDTVLPQRPQARKAALEWLAGGTFTTRLESVPGLCGALLERTVSALALIAERTAQWPAPARPELGALAHRLEARMELPPSCITAEPLASRTATANEQPACVPGQSASAAASLTASGLSPHTAGEVASGRDLLERARHMAQFLRAQPGGYLAAYRLMRCVRWDVLGDVPPHDAGGKTRLAPPRAELRAQLQRLLLRKQWPELLERIEQAFAESTNHFWLDLQYYAFTAQQQAGGEYAAARDIAATDCALLLERLDGLAQLSFADGTPFADTATLEWIGRYATVHDVERGEAAAPVPVALADPDWAELEAQAHDLAAQQSLDAAFVWLQALPMQPGERVRFARQLVMARVAERAERPDTALHLLATLEHESQRFELACWEPALAFEVKQHLRRLLAARLHRKDADKPTLARRIEALSGELVALDPARAVALAFASA
jgi:type VI secretion system protein VasJ